MNKWFLVCGGAQRLLLACLIVVMPLLVTRSAANDYEPGSGMLLAETLVQQEHRRSMELAVDNRVEMLYRHLGSLERGALRKNLKRLDVPRSSPDPEIEADVEVRAPKPDRRGSRLKDRLKDLEGELREGRSEVRRLERALGDQQDSYVELLEEYTGIERRFADYRRVSDLDSGGADDGGWRSGAARRALRNAEQELDDRNQLLAASRKEIETLKRLVEKLVVSLEQASGERDQLYRERGLQRDGRRDRVAAGHSRERELVSEIETLRRRLANAGLDVHVERSRLDSAASARGLALNGFAPDVADSDEPARAAATRTLSTDGPDSRIYEMTRADVASGIPNLVSSVDDPGGDYIAPDPILRPGLVLNVEVTVLDSQGVDAVNRRISPKGEITLPMVGSLQVNGMTRKELIDKLTNAYREFFRFPQIAIQFVVDENDADDY